MKQRLVRHAFLPAAIVSAAALLTTAAHAANPPIVPHCTGWSAAASWAQNAPWVKILDRGSVQAAKATGTRVFYRPIDIPGGDDGWGYDGVGQANQVLYNLSQIPWASWPDAIGFRNEFNDDSVYTPVEFVKYYDTLRAGGYNGIIVFGSWGVGWPTDDYWAIPAVVTAVNKADALETHEYFDQTVAYWDTWLAHRVNRQEGMYPFLKEKPWFIGEFGSDRCGNQDPQGRRGWNDRGKISAANYQTQIGIYRSGDAPNGVLACADNIVCVMIFTEGGGWSDFDILNTSVAPYVASTWTRTPGWVTGTVKDTSGSAISGAVLSSNIGGYSATTNGSGSYTVSSVTPWTYKLTASKSGFLSSTNNAVSVGYNQATTVNFTLQSTGGGTISGNVKNSGGQNLSGAMVSTNNGGYSATTDSNGNYTMSNVTPGTYDVTAAKSTYQSSTQTGKTVTLNQTTTVNFTLSPVTGGVELLSNGSFNTGCSDWAHTESPASIYWGCGNKAYPTDSAGAAGHSWNAFLACSGTWCDQSFTGEQHQDNVLVSGAASYSASAQVYYEPVKYAGVAGDQKERLALAFNNGTTHYSSWHTHTTANGWDPITYSDTVPATATSMTFRVELSHVDGQWSGTGAVDECSFISASPACSGPSITTQPQSQTKCSGLDVTFSVAASGSSPRTFQWRKAGTNISGATSSSYYLAVVASGDAGNYDCVVTNSCGSATSNAATLTVNLPVSITTQPQSQTKNVGDSCTFTVAASGSGTLSYQWRKGGTGISGATSSNYIISSVATGDAGNYDCVISNSCGSVTSNTAVLTVTGIAAESFESTPSWSSSYDAGWGSPANWSITSGGQSGNFLQASRSANGSSSKVKVYAVPTNSELTISVYIKCPSYSGAYWVEFAYKLGNNTADNFDNYGSTWTLIKKFSNSGGFDNGNGNTWTIYSVTLPTGSNTQVSIGYKHGASGCVGPNTGWDTFKIANAGSCTAPAITTQPQSQSKSIGSSCTLTVAASGTAPLSYQWRKGGSNIIGGTMSSYTISSVQSSDAGNYDCLVTNACGSATSNAATLTVTGGGIVQENFESMPAWDSSWDAGWGSPADWSIVSGGQSGNFLQASRTANGSSEKVRVYTVPASTNITISVYIKCPSYSNSYWAEYAYKFGNNTAQNFDENGGTWTMVKKFSNSGGFDNGNGNTWTQYSTTVNTGSNTQISIGYKHGASGCVGPAVGWDAFAIN